MSKLQRGGRRRGPPSTDAAKPIHTAEASAISAIRTRLDANVEQGVRNEIRPSDLDAKTAERVRIITTQETEAAMTRIVQRVGALTRAARGEGDPLDLFLNKSARTPWVEPPPGERLDEDDLPALAHFKGPAPDSHLDLIERTRYQEQIERTRYQEQIRGRRIGFVYGLCVTTAVAFVGIAIAMRAGVLRLVGVE